MSEIEFNYNQDNLIIQCNKDEKMKDIIIKFCTKIGKNYDDLYLLYDGNKINEESTFFETANRADKIRNKIRMFAFESEKMLPQENKVLKISKNIICPICKESSMLKYDNYKFNFSSCLNGHLVGNILINEFEKTQMIDESIIICESCKEKNKGNTFDNKFYRCLSCKLNLCPLCSNSHKNKNHNIIDYENKNFLCNLHQESFNSYCQNCKIDICIMCEKEHNKHDKIYYGNIIPDIDKIKENFKELRNKIEEYRKDINEIITKLNYVIENLDTYYKINNDIINNYNNKNRNYFILQNINNINLYINNFIENLKNIIKNKNIEEEIINTIILYNEMKDNPNKEMKKDEIKIKEENIKKDNNLEKEEINKKVINEDKEANKNEKEKDLEKEDKEKFNESEEEEEEYEDEKEKKIEQDKEKKENDDDKEKEDEKEKIKINEEGVYEQKMDEKQENDKQLYNKDALLELLKTYFDKEDNYQNFKIKDIKKLIDYDIQNDYKIIKVLPDGKILLYNEFNYDIEKTTFYVNEIYINDIVQKQVNKLELNLNESVEDIIVMRDGVLILKVEEKIYVDKIKENEIENIQTIDIKISRMYQFLNNIIAFLDCNSSKLLYYQYEQGILIDTERKTTINTYLYDICEINEKQIVVYCWESGKIYGWNDFLYFYDTKYDTKIDSIKIGDGDGSNKRLVKLNNYFILLQHKTNLYLVDINKRKLKEKITIYTSNISSLIHLNEDSFLVKYNSDEICQYDFNVDNKPVYKDSKNISTFESFMKYPGNKIIICRKKMLTIYG